MLVVGLYALAVRLDADYLETAVRVSQKLQERKRRVMSEGLFALQSKSAVRSVRLRQPPWLGGVGPLAWRQAIQLFRGGRRMLLLAGIAAVAIGLSFAFGMGQHKQFSTILPHLVIGISAYVTFLFSAQIPAGFRGDYGRLDLLKSLPIRPAAMACGQTLVAALILTIGQWLLFAAAAALAPHAAGELLVAGLFAPHFNWLLFATEDFLFLLYPSPLATAGSEGFFRMGRVMLSMLTKALVLGVCGVAAAIPAAIVYLLTASMPAAWLTAWLVLLVPAAIILLLLGWAFRRCDVGA
jgi:hypothetical protein